MMLLKTVTSTIRLYIQKDQFLINSILLLYQYPVAVWNLIKYTSGYRVLADGYLPVC